MATRHILATEFRDTFYKKIDILLGEKLLMGSGAAAHEILRPIAISTLADLIHHARTQLTIAQFSKTIYIFSRNVHDYTLPLRYDSCSSVFCLLALTHGVRFVQRADRVRSPHPEPGGPCVPLARPEDGE